MQSWIRSDLQRDIQQAYALMRSARFTDSPGACERARLMLHDVLNIDPDNEDAQILLSRVQSMLQDAPQPPVEAAPFPQPLQSIEPATEINDLHSADVCFSTVFPQVRFAHPRPRSTR